MTGPFETSSGARPRSPRRSLLVTSAALVVLLALLAMATWAYRTSVIESERRDVALRLTPYSSALSNVVAARVGLLTGLQQFVTIALPSGPTSESFRPFAAGLYSGVPGVRAIQVARGDVIELMYPIEGNEAAIGLPLLTDPRLAVRADVRRTIDSTGVTVGGPYKLAQGGTGVVLRQAVRGDGGYWGLAAVVIDLPTVLSQASLSHAPSGLRYAVSDATGATFAGDATVFGESPVIQDVRLPEGRWQVAAMPSSGWDATALAAVLSFAAAGLVIVGLLTTAVYTATSREERLADDVRARTEDLQAANTRLTADIRGRREAERALEESEQRYRTLFEATPVALWEEDFSAVKREVDTLAITCEGRVVPWLDEHPDEVQRLLGLVRIIAVNQATVQLLELASKEEALRGFAPFIAPSSMDVLRDELVAIASGDLSFSCELTSLTGAGEPMYLGVTVTVVPGFEDNYERVIVASVDLTERKKAEDELARYRDQLEALVEERTAELRRANDELRAATRARDDFFAAMSHELRTPLNSILGFTGVVLSGMAGEVNEEQGKQLSMVRRSGRHLLNLVNDLLDLTRLEATGMPPEPTDFDLGDVLDIVTKMVTPQATEKGIDIGLEMPVPDVRMHTDRGQLEQILLNLVGNAVKFSWAGVVRVSSFCSGGSVLVAVSDDGPGIPGESLEVIFDEFQQLSRPEIAKPEGTGLGLAISRRLARGLGGDISVRSAPGCGSTFTLVLPRVVADDVSDVPGREGPD